MLKVLLVVLLIALVVYGVTRLVERRGLPRPQRREPPRQVAPDDDPDFLWRLEAERRRQAKQNGGAPSGTPPQQPEGEAEPQDETPGEDPADTP